MSVFERVGINANFGFLVHALGQPIKLGMLAERAFSEDLIAWLIRLRRFGVVLGQEVATRAGAFTSSDETPAHCLRRLGAEGPLDRDV